MTSRRHSKWIVPGLAAGIGLAMLAAQWAAGNPGAGLVSLGIMLATGAIFLFGGRSETIRGLRGDGRDERFRQIDVLATAIAGLVVITAVIVAFIVEIARGHDGTPYTWLGALGGLAYVAAIVWLRMRG
jgi:drug/metabolite transporter (DMT)-like permease